MNVLIKFDRKIIQNKYQLESTKAVAPVDSVSSFLLLCCSDLERRTSRSDSFTYSFSF